MANGDFFSNMMGFSTKYTETAKSQINDDTDYDAVDFCQGEDSHEIQDNQFFLFDSTDEVSSKGYSSNDCLFNFDAESDDESLV